MIEAKSPSERLRDLLGKWMLAYGEMYQRKITDELLSIYVALLEDVEYTALERALTECARQAKFFPTVAEIRGAVTSLTVAGDLMAAETSWEAFKRLYGFWHPDVGFSPNAPKLDAAGEYAMRTIGGVTRFHVSEIEHEGFIRKEYIAAYQRYRETGGFLAPTREEAKKMVAFLSGKITSGDGAKIT